MEARNVKVSLETAKRWYEQGGEFKQMALSAFTEAELNPVRNEWESMFVGGKIKGYFIDHDESSIFFLIAKKANLLMMMGLVRIAKIFLRQKSKPNQH